MAVRLRILTVTLVFCVSSNVLSDALLTLEQLGERVRAGELFEEATKAAQEALAFQDKKIAGLTLFSRLVEKRQATLQATRAAQDAIKDPETRGPALYIFQILISHGKSLDEAKSAIQKIIKKEKDPNRKIFERHLLDKIDAAEAKASEKNKPIKR